MFVYSVMHSDGNNFWGEVILNSFINASGDEDSILAKHIYRSKYVRIFIMMIIIFHNMIENAY